LSQSSVRGDKDSQPTPSQLNYQQISPWLVDLIAKQIEPGLIQLVPNSVLAANPLSENGMGCAAQ